MKIFENLFSSNNKNDFWKHLKSIEDVEEALDHSETKKIVIFKHSTRCIISKTVLKNFENEVQHSERDVTFYYLDLLMYRGVSNYIAEKLVVTHQSPQLIIIENRKVINHASHDNISLDLVP